MFGAKFQRKYALTGQGVENVKKGTFWTVWKTSKKARSGR